MSHFIKLSRIKKMIEHGFAIFLIFYFLTSKAAYGLRTNDYFKSSLTETAGLVSPLQMIRKNGYRAESHTVQTEDGYLLTLHRIPHGRARSNSKKPYPMLLHHGYITSSFDWIVQGSKKSLAYRLADEGHDVWMINNRGNTFSKRHVSLNPSQKEFWNFTFHEIGAYDLSATIDYVLHTTHANHLVHIGLSLGTTVFYVLTSTRPRYNDLIKFHISLAPVAFLSHIKSITIRFLMLFMNLIKIIHETFYAGAFLEHNLITQKLMKALCDDSALNSKLCGELIETTTFGEDVQQFNADLIPLLTSNYPAGTSVKTFLHFFQLIISGKFQQYDYGTSRNIRQYQSVIPPLYNISQITTPVRIYYGQNDFISVPEDVNTLYQKLPRPLGKILVNYEKFNHIDFVVATDINELIYNELVQFIKNATTSTNFVETRINDAIEEQLRNAELQDASFNDMNFYIPLKKFSRKNKVVFDV